MGIGRSGADSEPSFGGGLVRPRNAAVSERAVGERTFQKSPCRLLKASITIPPTLLTPAGVPVVKITLERRTRSRIGVTAIWHRQQSTSPTLWDRGGGCQASIVVVLISELMRLKCGRTRSVTLVQRVVPHRSFQWYQRYRAHG